MSIDRLSILKVSLNSAFESLDVAKETFISIIQELNIQIKYNEGIMKRDEVLGSNFRINNVYFSEYDYISLRDKLIIREYIEKKRDGRKKCLGQVYKVIDKSTVCRVIDFQKEGKDFEYTVEELNPRFNVTEFYCIRKIKEDEIGDKYSGIITTPFVDPQEFKYERWVQPSEIEKGEYY